MWGLKIRRNGAFRKNFLFLADRVETRVESGLMRTEIAREFVPGRDQAVCREVVGALELP